MNVAQGRKETIVLGANQILTVVAAAGSTGTLWRLANQPGGAGDTLGSWPVASASTVTVGPYGTTTRYEIVCASGSLAYSDDPQELSELIAAINALSGSDLLLSGANLAIGAIAAAKVMHDQFDVQFDGVRFAIAAGEVAFTATTHDIADPDTDPREAVYVLSIAKAATAPVITKGTTAAAGAAAAPATPAGHIKIGEVLIQHDGSAIFDATSDDLDAAHLTVTYTSATPAPISV